MHVVVSLHVVVYVNLAKVTCLDSSIPRFKNFVRSTCMRTASGVVTMSSSITAVSATACS